MSLKKLLPIFSDVQQPENLPNCINLHLGNNLIFFIF